MKKVIIALLPVAFLLSACDKASQGASRFSSTGVFGLGNGDTSGSLKKTLFVGAGQSNMSSEHLTDTFPRSVNVAVGGTSQNLWAPGQPLYNDMVKALKSGGDNVALLFWQGESEGLYNGPDAWAQYFEDMVKAARQEVGHDFPVVFVQIGQTTLEGSDRSYWAMIQAQQASVHMQGVAMVSAKDLFPDADKQIHYSQAQYKIMQLRMLEAYRALTQ